MQKFLFVCFCGVPLIDATYAQTLPRAGYTKVVPRQAASATRVKVFNRPEVPSFRPSTFRQPSVAHAEIRGVGAIEYPGLSHAEMAWADTAKDWAAAARMAMTMEDDTKVHWSETGVVEWTTQMAEKAREAARVAGQIAKESAATKLEAASSTWTGAASAWVVAAQFMGNAATEGWSPQAAKAIEQAARFTQEGWAESSKTRAQRAPAAAAAAPAVAEAWGQAAAGWEAAAQFLQFGDFEYVAQAADKAEQESAGTKRILTERVWASEAKWQSAANEWLVSAKQAVASESGTWTASIVQKAQESAALAKLTAQEVAEHEPASQKVVGKWSAAALAWQEASQSKEEVETARAIEVAAEATSDAWSATSRAEGAPTNAQEHGQTWAKTAAMWEGAADYLTSGDFGESMHPALAAQSSSDEGWRIRYFAAGLLGACVGGIAVAALRAQRIRGLTKDAATPFLYN